MTTPKTPVADPTPAAPEPGGSQSRGCGLRRRVPGPAGPGTGPVDTSPIAATPAALEDLDGLWRAVVPETRTRGNDIHLPISLAYAERLCRAYPDADAELVRVAILLHDTGWAHVDESRIISEGFTGDWRKAAIRYEHEKQGCDVARRVLPGLGYAAEFVERVCAIIDGHDTRPVAQSLEDALMRDADRLWRFDQAGIALASSWFGMDPATYTDRLATEIVPELITQAADRHGDGRPGPLHRPAQDGGDPVTAATHDAPAAGRPRRARAAVHARGRHLRRRRLDPGARHRTATRSPTPPPAKSGAPSRTAPPKTWTPPSAPPAGRSTTAGGRGWRPPNGPRTCCGSPRRWRSGPRSSSLTNTRENGSPVSEIRRGRGQRRGHLPLLRHPRRLPGARGRPGLPQAAAASPWSGATRSACAR